MNVKTFTTDVKYLWSQMNLYPNYPKSQDSSSHVRNVRICRYTMNFSWKQYYYQIQEQNWWQSRIFTEPAQSSTPANVPIQFPFHTTSHSGTINRRSRIGRAGPGRARRMSRPVPAKPSPAQPSPACPGPSCSVRSRLAPACRSQTEFPSCLMINFMCARTLTASIDLLRSTYETYVRDSEGQVGLQSTLKLTLRHVSSPSRVINLCFFAWFWSLHITDSLSWPIGQTVAYVGSKSVNVFNVTKRARSLGLNYTVIYSKWYQNTTT